MRSPPAMPGSLAVEPSLRGLPRSEEFLQFIVANPDDDAPRLILADYLSDHGLEERAELIRIQCRMYRLEAEEREAGAEYGRLERRSDAILARNAKAWKPGPVLSECLFHRGLLETYRVEDLSRFLEIAPRVFEQTTIQVLRVRAGRTLRRLFALSGLDHLYELDLSGAHGDEDDLLALAASPWLARVRELTLRLYSPSLRVIQALAGSSLLGSLRILQLGDIQLSTTGLETLLQAPWFRGLVRLHLASPRLTQQGMRLLGNTLPPSLTWLDLTVPLGGPLIEVFAQSLRPGRLRTLMLGRCFYERGGAEVLARAPSLTGLERLGLASNHLGGTGLRALLQSPSLTRLTELDLEHNDLTSADVSWLAASPLASRLTGLNLQQNQIDDSGALELATAPHLRCLTELFLDHNQITDSGAWALASSSLDSLHLLSLEHNQIGDDGARALLHSPLAARGTEIRLFGNPISQEVSWLLRQRMTIRPED